MNRAKSTGIPIVPVDIVGGSVTAEADEASAFGGSSSEGNGTYPYAQPKIEQSKQARRLAGSSRPMYCPAAQCGCVPGHSASRCSTDGWYVLAAHGTHAPTTVRLAVGRGFL